MELSQCGYSHSGIAKELDVTDATAKRYLRKIEKVKGAEALV
jgi:predicted transcriptional regulator